LTAIPTDNLLHVYNSEQTFAQPFFHHVVLTNRLVLVHAHGVCTALVGWGRGWSPSVDTTCTLIAYRSMWVSTDISHYRYYRTTL